uniref:Uncharacterized protein n=1 Tax=Populus trichocarpa TaxID=3694 RepID=A0A3N7F7Q9_POPTR
MAIAREVATLTCLGEDAGNCNECYFLQATMESIGISTRVQTAFRMSEVAEPYIRRRDIRHLEKGRVVIFAAVVLKATNVDGDGRDCHYLCQENNIPVVVFNLSKPGNIAKAIKGERVGTLIGGTCNSTVIRT